jgi:DNA-binding NarL/FixJ family response regulator
MPRETKFIVAENHTISRKGYISLLKECRNFKVVGEAANGKDLIDILNSVKADVILLDIEMPIMSGREALKVIKERFPEVKVIILSFHTEESVIVECISNGASAFIPKESTYETFIETINLVIEEGYCYNRSISKALVNELSRKNGGSSPNPKLTERETEIIVLICEGKTNKEIARRLNIVVKTVDFHKSNIYKKTRTYTTAGLYNFAIKSNLIADQE